MAGVGPLHARRLRLGRRRKFDETAGERFGRRLSAAVTAIVVATAIILVASRLGHVQGADGAGDPIVVAAGDIACDPGNTNFNAGAGKNGACMQQSTYNLIAGMSPPAAAVLPLGDNQYYCGGYQAFVNSYALSWGRLLSKTYPVVGNHEYLTAPGSDGVGTGCDTSNTNAAGYFKYYAGAAKVGTSGEGWYSYDIGSWHLVAINSNCPNKSCGTSGAQYQWLANDLATHKNQCIAAYWHIPLWSSGGRAAPNTQQIVNQLYSAHADVILNGHDHIYERFAPQNSSGGSDPTRGIVEFIAGTGGANHTSLATTAANSVYRDDKNFGVLKLTLHPASYDYAFVNTAGTVLDSNGSTPVACHNTGSSGTVPPAPTVTASGSDATDYGTGTTAYYRQGTAGSFTVAATSAGATSMTFPSISGLTGGGADTSAPFSATYTRTASTTPSGSFGVTASNTAGTSPSTSFTVTPDGTSPLTTASCIPSNCAAASGSQVSVTLTSTDTGSGVAAIYYTTNGTAPTTSSPSVSSGTAVNVPAGQTIQFFGVDRVGNQESIKSKATTVSAGGSGPIVLQQQKTGSASSSPSLTVPLTASTSGDTLVATVAIAAGSTGPLASVTDSSGGSWTKGPIGFLSGANTRVEMWYRVAAPSVTSATASFASGTTKSLAMSVSEWSGVASASALDVQGNSSGSSATTATSPALTTTNATDVVIGALNYTGSATSTAGGTGFAPLSNFDVSSTHGRASYNVTTTAGSYQASWSLSAASSYGAAALALKAGSTGPTDTTPPTTSITCNSSACSSSAYSATVQVALSATDSGGSGLKTTYYTTDGSDPTSSASRTAYSSPFTLNTTTTVKYSSVDNANNVENVKSQTITINTDTTPPTTSITCNSSACSSSAYSATVQVALSATDSGGSGLKTTYYTTDGSDPTSSASRTAYSSPFTLNTTTTVKYSSVDNANNVENVNTQQINVDTTAPTTTATCNGTLCSGTYASNALTVQVLLRADDGAGSGVAATYYSTDGGATYVPYLGGISLVSDTVLEFYSVDNAGHNESTNTLMVTFDSTPPTTTIGCNATGCGSTTYTGPVSVSLSADDGAGSGVSATSYTTDGTDPTSSASRKAYSGSPFTLNATANVRFYSTDNAGNAESVNSQQITIDATAPTTTATCNGFPCSGTYLANGLVQVALTADDQNATIHYTTDGSTPTTSSPAYAFPIDVAATETIKYFAIDTSNNSENVNTLVVMIDGSAPTTTITCNAATCSSSAYTSAVTVALSATDTGGSGVDKTYYTTDGSPPTTSSTTYTSPFSVSSTTTVRFFSTDKAGNAESPGSQTITITSGGGGGGTIALQRQATASSSASVGSLTVSIPATTTGDALVAAIAVQAASTGPINTVTDSAGGTWTRGPTGSLTGSNTRIELWYRLNASSVTSVTASFASGTSKPLAINLTEWSGVASASAADGQTNGTGTSTTAAPPALTTTNASDVVFGAINFSSTSASSGAPSGGFIALNDFNMSTSHGRAAYKIVSTAGSYQPTWTLSVSSPFGAAALALKSS